MHEQDKDMNELSVKLAAYVLGELDTKEAQESERSSDRDFIEQVEEGNESEEWHPEDTQFYATSVHATSRYLVDAREYQ